MADPYPVEPHIDAFLKTSTLTDAQSALNLGTAALADIGSSVDNVLTVLESGSQSSFQINNSDGTLWSIAGYGDGGGSYNLVLPTAHGSFVLHNLAQTLSNKTMSGSVNAFTNIPLSTAVTGTLDVNKGGTGITSPGISGNVLTSNGSAWISGSPFNPAIPGPIGGTTPSTGAFTTLTLGGNPLLSGPSAATLQLGTNIASGTSPSINQTIKAHDNTPGIGANLTLQGGTGGAADGTVRLMSKTILQNDNDFILRGGYGYPVHWAGNLPVFAVSTAGIRMSPTMPISWHTVSVNGTGADDVTLSRAAAGVLSLSVGRLRLPNLPTSSAGLVAGDLWNDAGTVKIIP